MSARVKPLAKLLEQQLHIPVTVTVSTNYNTIVEAMGSKKVDVGFLPPDAYVQAHKQYGVKVLLQAQRFGYKEPDDQQTNQLVNYYRAQIVVRKGSGIKNLKDLKFERQEDRGSRYNFKFRLGLPSCLHGRTRDQH